MLPKAPAVLVHQGPRKGRARSPRCGRRLYSPRLEPHNVSTCVNDASRGVREYGGRRSRALKWRSCGIGAFARLAPALVTAPTGSGSLPPERLIFIDRIFSHACVRVLSDQSLSGYLLTRQTILPTSSATSQATAPINRYPDRATIRFILSFTNPVRKSTGRPDGFSPREEHRRTSKRCSRGSRKAEYRLRRPSPATRVLSRTLTTALGGRLREYGDPGIIERQTQHEATIRTRDA